MESVDGDYKLVKLVKSRGASAISYLRAVT